MLKLITWSTQNARKISIMLAACQLDYDIQWLNIEENEQHQEGFKALNPNGKIPVLMDTELLNEQGQPEPIFESAAILLYLAEKSERFLAKDPARRMATLNWLFWQGANLGPVLGNFSHFAAATVKDSAYLNNYLIKTRAPKVDEYAIQRFTKESFRLLGVLNQQLEGKAFMTEAVSIADFAIYPWLESAWLGLQGVNPNINQDFKNLSDWMARMKTVEGVEEGMKKLAWGVRG
jgi:GST-like protein